MTALILGADGFIGRSVKAVFTERTDYEIYTGTRDLQAEGNNCYIDLSKRETIARALRRIRPEVIINCAGVVGQADDPSLNVKFTTNLLEEILASGLKLERIIISGSAAEYGIVDPANIPVSEEAPLNATSGYGLSKVQEVQAALEYRRTHHLPVVIARIFNPVGVGMHPKFLLSRIIRQVEEIRSGQREDIEVSRLDARRDYISVEDVASAIRTLAEHKPKSPVYNIGTGESTSNGELIDLILHESGLSPLPQVVQTSSEPEPLVAVQADITRLTTEFGWKPTKTIKETVKEIMYAAHAEQ